MSYLERFWTSLCAIFLRLDRIPRAVSPQERISRFIFHKSYMDEANNWVSYQAFMPPKKPRETSVYRTARCSERRVWLLGDIFVARPQKDRRPICGRADVEAEAILQQALRIIPRPSPHPRHAVVTSWPDDKPQQKVKAMALAQRAILRIYPGRERPN